MDADFNMLSDRQATGHAGLKAAAALRAHPWRALLALLLVIGLVLAGLIAYLALNAERIADEIAAGVPLEQENALGELVLAEARLRVRLGEEGPAAEAVRTIGRRLTTGSRFRYRWFVGERSERNAFAVPGGVVIVYTGLIELAQSPEELAGVIAHEVAHVELRHGLRAAVQRLGLAGLIRLVLGGASDRFGETLGNLGAAGFSRETERAADRDAVRRLLAAGIDPSGLPAIYARLDPGASGLAASHPATAERIAALRAEIARLQVAGRPPADPLPIDWPAVRAAVRR